MSLVASDPMTTRVDVDRGAVLDELETQRRALTGYCYRMLGSAFEADDAVQETMIRAWKGIEGFEGRSALRSWLYRIATNVCLDMLRGPQRRARPMDLGPASTADAVLDAGQGEHAWIRPVHDAVVPADRQAMFAAGVGADVVDLDSAHMAMISHPAELAALLLPLAP